MTAAGGAAAVAANAALPLGDSAHDELPGADSFLFFDDSGKVLAASFKARRWCSRGGTRHARAAAA
jgi:hypothetical protein